MNLKDKETKYKKNLSWNLLLEDGRLFITKGSDEIYFIDEIDAGKSTLLFRAYEDDTLEDLFLEDEEIGVVIKKIEKAGVIYKSLDSIELKANGLSVAIRWIGNENKKVKSLLENFISKSENISISNNIKDANVLFIIRSSGKLVDVLKDYGDIRIPHIFIDLAYDHTISIGPLVFPKETACLGCFIGRITRNWGDATPPEVPNALDSYELITSLIFEHIKIFQKFNSCPELVNQVLSMNLRDLTTKYDKIFRLPWCPICFPEKPEEGVGSFELPWRINNNQLK